MVWLHNHRHRLLIQQFCLQPYLELLKIKRQHYDLRCAIDGKLQNHFGQVASHQEPMHVV